MHSLSLTGAIRNLKYWTPFVDGDPASSNPDLGSSGESYTLNNTTTVNNDIRGDGTSAVLLR